MCILGGFIPILLLSGIWYFSLQVHCLETKDIEMEILVFHKTCVSSLVASTLFSKFAFGGACEAQETLFGLYPSCDG